jgi:hypothetical protein
MKSGSGAILGLTLLAGLLAATSARAEDAPQGAAPQGVAQDASQDASKDASQACDVPAYLLTSESTLPKVADAIKNGHPLDILVVGSRSSTILTMEASAFPARLQAILKEKLPSVTVNVSVELRAKKTAEEVVAEFVKLV